jgi:hypothetical protein
MNQQSVTHWRSRAAVKGPLRRPLRDLRIAVIDRNYRCPYRTPAELFGENRQFLPHPHSLASGASGWANCATRAASCFAAPACAPGAAHQSFDGFAM